MSFLYPRYSDVENALTISQAPLVRLKVMNLLRYSPEAEPSDAPPAIARPTTVTEYTGNNDAGYGLLGVITNVNIDYHLGDDIGTLVIGADTIVPKLLEITVDFNAIHEHPLGWNEDDNFNYQWPYGVNLDDTSARQYDAAMNAEGNTDSGAADGDNEASAQEAAAAVVAVHYGIGNAADVHTALESDQVDMETADLLTPLQEEIWGS